MSSDDTGSSRAPTTRTKPVDKAYYETINSLDRAGVDWEYIHGWIGGYMSNPQRESQRSTDAYEAGYADGENNSTESAGVWKKS